jgi:hypothetical protein
MERTVWLSPIIISTFSIRSSSGCSAARGLTKEAMPAAKAADIFQTGAPVLGVFNSMPRGANTKREREYNELKREFKKEHRYKGREEEVAARIVNKQRARFGETKGEKRKDRQGKSPDRDLPIKNYQHKTIPQVERALKSLSGDEVKEIERYEKKHKKRKTLLEAIRAQAKNGSASRSSSSKSNRGDHHKTSKRSGSSAKSSRSKSSSRSSGRSAHRSAESEGKITTDHDEIRQWVEARGGHPATVRRTVGKGHEPGILRIDFPDYSGGKSLEAISWDEFFDKFEKEKLAFLHQDETSVGKESRFNKLIAR